ncbi:MAG: DNA-binding protein, partial [Desulforhopalus sp.]
APPAQAMPKTAPQSAPATVTGTVLETMDAAGYTYLLVDTTAGQNWVAIPQTKVEKGSTVQYYEGMVMKDFASKTLDRTFPAIVFSPGLAGTTTDETKEAAATPTNDSFAAAVEAERETTASPPPVAASGGSSGAVVPLEEIAVEKSSAANGYSIEEVFTKAAELNGKKIQVHAKVVKFSPLIMGKNWIHLQDGTGDPMHNSHDLVATTDQTVEVGTIVVVEGVLAANKDFGAGYKYDAIIEDAAIVK